MAEAEYNTIIVGAGIAGVMAAKILTEKDHSVLILERDAVIGGRMGTLHFAGGVFDHGAQFFTVKDPRFSGIVDQLIKEGIVIDWFRSQLIKGGTTHKDGHPRYCGVNGMSSIVSRLATSLNVKTASEVKAIEASQGNWKVHLTSGESYTAKNVILTCTIPENLSLLGNSELPVDEEQHASLLEVTYQPGIAVIATLDKPSALTEWGALRIAGTFIDFVSDNHRKGISKDKPALTIQAMPKFSQWYWDTDDEDIINMLIDNIQSLIVSHVEDAQVYRWRYSKPQNTHPDPFLTLAGYNGLFMAGDAFRHHRVEGAVLSGINVADHILKES
ncbi:FAD-dependent oxidoreductase [bacterium]|nr:FAD-dependent oxidoreductase [bacterium]